MCILTTTRCSFHSVNNNAIVALRPIEDWDVSKITNMDSIFRDAPGVETCNPDIGNWDVSKVEIYVSQSLVSMRLKSRILTIFGTPTVMPNTPCFFFNTFTNTPNPKPS